MSEVAVQVRRVPAPACGSNPLRPALLTALAVLAAGLTLGEAGAQVPVGTYLYANPKTLESCPGSLRLSFSSPGDRRVVVFGRRHRKIHLPRAGTTEEQRERFKPVEAQMLDDGRTALFPHLPADLYDVLVISAADMTLHEGLQLAQESSTPPPPDAFEAVRKSLAAAGDRVGGWEAFFDTKDFLRFGMADGVGCVLVQQMRLAKAYAESGAELTGCVHAIHLCWVRPTLDAAGTWEVLVTQQLYREELPARTLFRHVFVPELGGIRVGVREIAVGPVKLE
ncbi:MAG: hypothetical protein BWZ02_00687 [Lentisphaerae bacterium ADurb.BinA184]|nr:MAG: hypothetical protein BWZ02_00687 [Lentisphaerae bacterium ADurb.BinA184]